MGDLVVLPPIVGRREYAGDVHDRLRGLQRHNLVSGVMICEHERAIGVVRYADLIVAPADTLLEDLPITALPAVAENANGHTALWAAVAANQCEVTVNAENGTFLGIVPAGSLLSVCFNEHENDLASLSGYIRQGASARRAAEEPIGKRLWHRLPWLLVGLAGATGASLLVSRFEATIREVVALSFFVPAIVYLADAVGTQTEAIIVRGLAMGVRVRDIAVRELLTGLTMGLFLAVVFLPGAAALSGSWLVAAAVGISLAAACAVANVVAVVMPWALAKVRLDPAFGAGPLATVIQDLLSIAIYFSVASAMLK